MELKTKYITADDYKMYFGLDLSANFEEDDNPSNTANAFLYRIETLIAGFIDANFYQNVDVEYKDFTDYQKEHYKIALLEQAFYVIRNSDISSDSGYDVERGIIAQRNELKELSIAPNCKDQLILCGLWNRHIKTRSRGMGDDWFY